MKVSKYFLPFVISLASMAVIGYASWQFSGADYISNNGLIGVTNTWKLTMTMDENGDVYDGDTQIGHVVYENDENDLDGGTITSGFTYLDDGEAAVHNYLATQLGSNIHLITSTDVHVTLPSAIHNNTTGNDEPIVGVDHLGSYITVGGPLRTRYIYLTIPEGYTFIGNYAFFLTGSDHADTNFEFNIPSTVEYLGHEAFNFSTLNQMKSMWDQKYKFHVNYGGTASEFLELIARSKALYEEKYYGYKKAELEEKCKHFQEEVDDTGGIIYSGSTEYSWFFRPAGQSKGYSSSDWPAQNDYIDVYCAANPLTGKREMVRFTASSPIDPECEAKIAHYSRATPTYAEPQIIEIK